MNTYEVTLTLTIEEGNPRKWNWFELLDLGLDEQVWVSSKLIEEKEGE